MRCSAPTTKRRWISGRFESSRDLTFRKVCAKSRRSSKSIRCRHIPKPAKWPALPPNKIFPPLSRIGSWGYLSIGHFVLGDDEAFVVTLDPAGARYVGFELSDAWATPLEFVHHTASLANGQTKPSPDGTITYVTAAKDPGVFNWLDAQGSSPYGGRT